MNPQGPSTKPLSPEDKAVLKKLEFRAWYSMVRLYVPLFLFLLLIHYMRPGPGEVLQIKKSKITREEFDQVYPFLVVIFGGIFLFFAIKDFRRLILPFVREARTNTKYCHSFVAKKYHDPFSDRYLLFYPDKEDIYIEVCPEDFNSIDNGEDMYLEVASVTGEVLYLKSPEREFKDPEEFSFSDR